MDDTVTLVPISKEKNHDVLDLATQTVAYTVLEVGHAPDDVFSHDFSLPHHPTSDRTACCVLV